MYPFHSWVKSYGMDTYLEDLCLRCFVTKTVVVISDVPRTVSVGFLPELVLSISISVSSKRMVERSMLSTVSVTTL